MLVSEAVGRTVHALGGDVVFGLMGSGNLAVTNAIVAAGGRFFSARHETGAVCMADGYSRVSGKLGVASVHQGPGLTNAITGLTEAAKSRTPVLLLAADTPPAQLRSNFKIDQDALVESVGAVSERVHSPATAVADTARAVRRGDRERRTVVLNLPLDVQAAEVELTAPPAVPDLAPVVPADLTAVVEALNGASRPAIIAGRGAVLSGAGPCAPRARRAARRRAGHHRGRQRPVRRRPVRPRHLRRLLHAARASEELKTSDVVIAFGAALNVWTTRHGALIGNDCTLIQVDRDLEAIGAHRPVDLGVVGDARAVATALLDARDRLGPSPRAAPPTAARWRDEPYEESRNWLDPRTLSIALDELLPPERTVVVDSGAFMGYPAMYLQVPDAQGFVFPQAFQCVGLALGNAIGAAVANPDRLTVCAVGDGGLLMSLPDLETLGRLKLNMVVVVYNDAAYGAEVHHFRPDGHPRRARAVPAHGLRRARRSRGLPRPDRADAERSRGP